MSELDIGENRSRRPWLWLRVGAAAIALALHVGGGALALSYLKNDESEPDLGASAIEVGVEMSAPRDEETDLPAGPDSNASEASPALAEQKAEVKDTDLPKDIPTETDDPDRVVTPNDNKKPVEDDTKVATVQTQ